MEVNRITLAELMERSPGSSAFTELLLASRAFGLTSGGVNAANFSLTDLGRRATDEDAGIRMVAHREAILKVAPFQTFLVAHDGKRLPASAAMRSFLIQKAAVPESRAEECAVAIVANSRDVGFIRVVKGNEYVDLSGADAGTPANRNDSIEDTSSEYDATDAIQAELNADRLTSEAAIAPNGNGHAPVGKMISQTSPSKPNQVFIAHGKNRGPMEQLVKILTKFGVPHKVAVDEPHEGRPVSAKVAQLMRECSSAIFIFTPDELFFREGDDGMMKEVWRPSENVVYELGAASILYDRRIAIFKEKKVTFPSDFSDLGYTSFDADAIAMQVTELIGELVSFDVLEVRAKG